MKVYKLCSTGQTLPTMFIKITRQSTVSKSYTRPYSKENVGLHRCRHLVCTQCEHITGVQPPPGSCGTAPGQGVTRKPLNLKVFWHSNVEGSDKFGFFSVFYNFTKPQVFMVCLDKTETENIISEQYSSDKLSVLVFVHSPHKTGKLDQQQGTV